MTETTAYSHKARGFFRCDDGIRFFAQFVVDGEVKPFAGKFDHKIDPFQVPDAILYYERLDELYAEFRIATHKHPFVGPGSVHLPFIKHELTRTTEFLIVGPLSGLLPEGFVVGGGGTWLVL